jgi:hypothetical protein
MDKSGNAKIISLLGLMTLISALFLPVNPWPLDGWFHTQDRLIGVFPGADNYTPIAAPAVFYKINHLLSAVLDLGTTGEFYLASVAQNGLIFVSACLILLSCRKMGTRWAANISASAFLAFALSTGVSQAMWSDSVVIFLFSALIFETVNLYQREFSPRQFGVATAVSGLMVGALIVTRAIPVLLIPCLALLLFGRLDRRRVTSYVASMSVISALFVLTMLTSNYARFGRFELTNSSGRHLWESVKTMSDRLLASSSDYSALHQIDPKIQGKGWWEIQLPSSAAEFHGERLFKSLAREAIANEPVLFLEQGVRKFTTRIARSPPRLGFYSLPDWYRQAPQASEWAGNPLQREMILSSFAVSKIGLPAVFGDIVYVLNGYSFWLTERLYPLTVFFVLTTFSAVSISARLDNYGGILHLPLGVAIVAITSFGVVGGLSWAFLVGCCSLLVVAQAFLIYQSFGSNSVRSTLLAMASRRLYIFFAVAFFGSIWVSWQIESGSPRHALSYSPFLAIMLGMALNFWTGEFECKRITEEQVVRRNDKQS